MLRIIITACLLLTAIIAGNFRGAAEPAIARTSLEEFPDRIGEWVMVKEHKMDDRSMNVLLVDDYIMRTYANGKGQAISLYIGYFKTQMEGKGNHSPRQCLPGAGWAPIETDPITVQISHNPGRIVVNRYLMEKGNEKDLFLFWYQGRGRQYANEYLNKLYLIWDSVTMNRTDGALIRLSMRVKTSPDQTLQDQTEFISSFYTMLSKYIPE